MPIVLWYEIEQEKREAQQDGVALENSLQRDEQRQIVTVPITKRIREWFRGLPTPSCRSCVNWQSDLMVPATVGAEQRQD